MGRSVKIVVRGKKNMPSINAILSRSWQVRRRQVGLAEAAVRKAIKEQGIDVVKFKKCRVIWDIYLDNKKRDIDNVATKFLLDALVSVGFIDDDNINHVVGEIKNAHYDRQDPRIEITIEEVE